MNVNVQNNIVSVSKRPEKSIEIDVPKKNYWAPAPIIVDAHLGATSSLDYANEAYSPVTNLLPPEILSPTSHHLRTFEYREEAPPSKATSVERKKRRESENSV